MLHEQRLLYGFAPIRLKAGVFYFSLTKSGVMSLDGSTFSIDYSVTVYVREYFILPAPNVYTDFCQASILKMREVAIFGAEGSVATFRRRFSQPTASGVGRQAVLARAQTKECMGMGGRVAIQSGWPSG